MPEKSISEILLSDSLSDVTRKERRILLGVSTISIAIVKAGLVPSKISALGIEFTRANEQALLLVLTGVVFYFFCAFSIYAFSDFLMWRHDLNLSMEEVVKKAIHQHVTKEKDNLRELLSDPKQRKHLRLPNTLPYLRKPVSFIRTFFDFFIPVGWGIFAIVSLLCGR